MDIRDIIRKKTDTFDTLDYDMACEVIMHARSLSIPEMYDFLLIDEEELSEAEIKFVAKLHKHGRAIGIKDAGDLFFQQMKGRNGGNHCLDYLRQHAGEFVATVTPSKTASGGFSFNVEIPEVE